MEKQEEARQDRGRKTTRTGDWWEDRRSKSPTRKFTRFTALTAPIDQVLMQIKDEGSLTFPGISKGGTKVYPLGAITLPVMVGDYPQQITKDVTFLVVECSFAYNAILGRPTLNS